MRCCRLSSLLQSACAKAGSLGLIQQRASTSSSSSPSMCCVLTSRSCTASPFATRVQRPECLRRSGSARHGPSVSVQVRRPHHAQIPRVGGEHRQRAAGAPLSSSGSALTLFLLTHLSSPTLQVGFFADLGGYLGEAIAEQLAHPERYAHEQSVTCPVTWAFRG